MESAAKIGSRLSYGALCLVTAVLFLPMTRNWLLERGPRWYYIFLLSFLLSLILTRALRRLARSFRVVNVSPLSGGQDEGTPLLGGVAINLSFIIPVVYNLYFSVQLKGVAIGATLVMLSGLADDLWDLPTSLKLMLQLIAVSIMIAYGVSGNFMPPSLFGDGLEILLTIIWMIGITNAVKFLDGVDGLATGLGLIASIFMGIVAVQTGQQFMLFLAVALVGSCLGFLPFNIRTGGPATISLGDAGSQFIGFTLAGMALMGDWAVGNPIKAYSIPVLILGIPIFDMTYITVTRIWSGDIRSFWGVG